MSGKCVSGPWATEMVYYGDSTRICAATLYGPDGSFATVENGSKWFYDEKRLSNADFRATVHTLALAPSLLNTIRAARWYLDEPNGVTLECIKELLDEAIVSASV